MGNMRLRAEDAAAKDAWVSSLQKQAKVRDVSAAVDAETCVVIFFSCDVFIIAARRSRWRSMISLTEMRSSCSQAMPPVAHLYSHDGDCSSARQSLNLGPPLPAAAASNVLATSATNAGAGQITKHRSGSFTIAEEGATAKASNVEGGGGEGGKATEGSDDGVSVALAIAKAASGEGGTATAAEAAAKELLASTVDTRKAVLRMGTVVQMEAKRNKRFRFFNDERWTCNREPSRGGVFTDDA